MKTSSRFMMRKYRALYVMLLPGALYFLIFKYLPMWGISLAFKNYSPYLGFWGSPWVGTEFFRDFLSSPDFFRLLKNTTAIAVLSVSIGFFVPVVLALCLNELRSLSYKKSIQTLIYLPHFASWTIVASISVLFLTPETGGIARVLEAITGQQVNMLTNPALFKYLILFQGIWKGAGWGTIIYLAALSTVDPNLYEAAMIDGASRFKRVRHVTFPAILPTVIVMLILRIGNFFTTGFDQIFLMTNPLNRISADVFDTFVYQVGIAQGQFSYGTAVGLFKSIVGIILIVGSNKLAKKINPESGIY